MSECTGPHIASITASNQRRAGSCSKGIRGVETKIDQPDENGSGEVSDVK